MEKNYLECLDGDSLIHTKQGLKKIKDLEGQEHIEVLSYNEKSKTFEYQVAEKCIKTKTDFVYNVQTTNYNIKATKDHRFLTNVGWRHLHKLKVGDSILDNTNKFEKIISIDKGNNVDVYDILNVNKNQNYICNSLVVHNSFVNYWCLTGDTKITTKDKTGMIRQTPIKKLNKYNPEVLTYNINTKKYEFKEYKKKIKTKENVNVFEVKLLNGLRIKCTEDHPFLTQRGWVRLKDLTDKDSVEVNTSKCKYCDKVFIPTRLQQIFCNTKCSDSYHVRSIRQKEYNKQYRMVNKDNNKMRCRDRYYKKHEEILKTLRDSYKKNRDVILQKHKIYRKTNRDKILIHEKKHLKTHLNYRISKIIRGRLNSALKRKNNKKSNSAIEYLGCTIDEFKIHISNQFVEGMSWENWGKTTWHIDHIKPCAKFNLVKEEERYKCFNYKNQQPMWASDNCSKGDKYVD